MSVDLVFVWACLLAFAVLAYVILDGFDLGIGILFPFTGSDQERDLMMNTVAPVWDGNETWLVLGGIGLFAIFPLAYSILLPAFYAPLIAMLLALIFRGVAFEFRFRTRRWKRGWDLGFVVGSLVATFCQGIALGAFIQGVAVIGRTYAGGWFDWLTAFSVFVGIALILGYAFLAATWLILKTEGAIQERFYRLAMPLGAALLASIAIVSLWTPLLDADIAARWFSWPNIVYVAPVPLLVAALAGGIYWTLSRRKEKWPFPLALGLFVLSYIGLGVSLFPYIVPRSITIWQAAAPESSLIFMLVGTAVLLPLILFYTGHAYWVFRGKVRLGEGYD